MKPLSSGHPRRLYVDLQQVVRSQSDGNPTDGRGWNILCNMHTDQRSQATIAFTDEERMNWHSHSNRAYRCAVQSPHTGARRDSPLQNSLSEDGLEHRAV